MKSNGAKRGVFPDSSVSTGSLLLPRTSRRLCVSANLHKEYSLA